MAEKNLGTSLTSHCPERNVRPNAGYTQRSGHQAPALAYRCISGFSSTIVLLAALYALELQHLYTLGTTKTFLFWLPQTSILEPTNVRIYWTIYWTTDLS